MMSRRSTFFGLVPAAAISILMAALTVLVACQGSREVLIPTGSHPRLDKVIPSLSAPLDIELMSFHSLDEINHYVNETIAYVADPPGNDTWQEPNQTLALRRGDCEDFALLKLALIRQRYPGIDAKLLLVYQKDTGIPHIVVVLHESIVLDNKFRNAIELNGPTFNSQYRIETYFRSVP